MATSCFSVVRGKRVRVTTLDECGAPPAAATANSQAVSSGFIEVNYEPEYEEGDDYTQKNADGDLCVNERGCDKLKRVNVTIDFCQVDPALLALITGSAVEVDGGGDTVGFRLATDDECSNFAVELWTGIPGQDCAAGAAQYGYLLLPFVKNGTLREFTIENGTATFQVMGWTSGGSNWGAGPYNVVSSGAAGVPSALEDPILAAEHMLLRLTDVAPPSAACGLQAMPAAPTPAAS